MEAFLECNIRIEGVNWAEAGKYLAINLSKEEITMLGLAELVSTRKKSRGACPGNTTAEVMGKLYREEGEEESSLFHPPRRAPATEEERKKVLAQVLRISILAVLTNHTYLWAGSARKQASGSPIGLELAGALARVVMLWWDRRFLSLASANSVVIYLYSRYIDDENMAGRPLAPGTRWEVGPWSTGMGGKMVVREDLVEGDLLLPADMRSMEEVRKMGNSILEMIQLEEDYPSKNGDNKLPILDLKVWVRQEEVEVEGLATTRPRLFYQYYRKEVSNWQLIPALSAMPNTVKRTALTQYGLRILRNSKLELEWEAKAEMLSTFCERMRDSGYGEKFRMQIISSILAGWRKMVAAQEEGVKPINRPRSWKEGEREENKMRKKVTWYKQGGYTTVMFCPFTPNSTLADSWREAEARGAATRGWRYRVVELGGRSVRTQLCRFPWGVPCTNPERCMVCSTGGTGPCTAPGCTYRVQCLACRDRGPDTVPLEEEADG